VTGDEFDSRFQISNYTNSCNKQSGIWNLESETWNLSFGKLSRRAVG